MEPPDNFRTPFGQRGASVGGHEVRSSAVGLGQPLAIFVVLRIEETGALI